MSERALVIVPTYNERENIRAIIDAALSKDPRIDMLIVDDGSPDGTGAIVDEIAAANPRVHCLHRAGKMGLGTAYLEGFRWALLGKGSLDHAMLTMSVAVVGAMTCLGVWYFKRAERTFADII